MSVTSQNLMEDGQTALTRIDNQVNTQHRKSGSIADKHITKTDRSSASNNDNEKPTDVEDITSFINPDFNKPMKLENHFTGSFDHDNDQIQSILSARENDQSNGVDENRNRCADNCICKIKEALRLIVHEIKKVDARINTLEAKSQCPYTPKPNDKKEFAKSVEKNSAVCHVIIEELKKQRREINEMLELYEEPSREFSKLEVTLNSQREKIEHIQTILDSMTNIVKSVKFDITKRHESFLLEMESRRSRVETREEILKVFLNWITFLDEKRFDDHAKFDSVVKETVEERIKDRLTLAIRQLEEVKTIEILLMTQNSTTTEGPKDTPKALFTRTQQVPMPAPFYKCAWPIDRVAIISGQCNNARANCASIANPGQFFNINSNRCFGGADALGTGNALGTVTQNGNETWYPRMPIRCYTNNHAPMIYQRRVPIGCRKSPTINSRRPRRNTRNVKFQIFSPSNI